MFTGIVETMGTVKEVIASGSNLSFWVESPLSPEFKIDQSVCHDGVCLTVEATREKEHKIIAVAETIKKTTLASWQPGKRVNIERSLKLADRLDGHIVQGHVDGTIACRKRKEKKGSLELGFDLPKKFAGLVIEKGSVCINGVSLTAFNVKKRSFMVTVIPYTLEHTNTQAVEKGDPVNIEFDLVGKYLLRKLSLKE